MAFISYKEGKKKLFLKDLGILVYSVYSVAKKSLLLSQMVESCFLR